MKCRRYFSLASQPKNILYHSPDLYLLVRALNCIGQWGTLRSKIAHSVGRLADSFGGFTNLASTHSVLQKVVHVLSSSKNRYMNITGYRKQQLALITQSYQPFSANMLGIQGGNIAFTAQICSSLLLNRGCNQ